jgi:hypothetical protein
MCTLPANPARVFDSVFSGVGYACIARAIAKRVVEAESPATQMVCRKPAD